MFADADMNLSGFRVFEGELSFDVLFADILGKKGKFHKNGSIINSTHTILWIGEVCWDTC